MAPIKMKSIEVFSNGSLSFSFNSISRLKQYNFFEKDHKNLLLNKKKTHHKIKSDSTSKYKNKYII